MPINVNIVPAVQATFNDWRVVGANTDTLLLYAHGMQGNTFFEPIGPGHIPIPPRNYAFTIPFNTALFNPAFTLQENWPRLRLFVQQFLRKSHQFGSRAPLLHIYPYLPPNQDIINALADLAGYNLCDILYFTDLTVGTDSITFEQFLRAQVPGGGGMTYARRYSSFLLLTCRTSIPPGQIGMGGAAPTTPNGLYPVRGARLIYIP